LPAASAVAHLGRVDRNTIRLALGQILDYAHIVKPRFRTVLVPEQLSRDLLALLHENNVQALWRSSDGNFDSSRLA